MGFGAAQVNQNLEHQSLKHLEFAVSPQGNFHLASSPQGNFRLKETCATRGAVARAPDTGRENSLRQGRQAAWIFGNLRFYSLRRRCHFHHLAIFKLRSARLLQDRSKSVETDTPIPSVGGARRLANSGAPPWALCDGSALSASNYLKDSMHEVNALTVPYLALRHPP